MDALRRNRPIRVLELRSVRGTGGGPEKTILLSAAAANPSAFQITVCYLRDERDPVFGIDKWAEQLGLDYLEVRERHSFDRAIWPALRRIVQERQIDIVHAHDYKTNALALLLGRAAPVVPLSTVHGWTGHTWRETRLYYPVDKRLLARFPRLIAVSDQIGRELVRYGAPPDRVRTILNGIDHRAFRRQRQRESEERAALGIARGQIVLGAVGRLEPQKRFDILLQAFAQLRRTRPALKLVIVGDGGERDALERLASQLRLGHAVRFTGHRTNVTDLHHAFDLFVQSSDYEGTPNAVLEAMAMETPTVATDVGGTSELMQQGIHGLITPPGDVNALEAAMARALDDPSAAHRRALAARRRIETELSFDARLRKVEAIYREIMSQPVVQEAA